MCFKTYKGPKITFLISVCNIKVNESKNSSDYSLY